MANAAPPFDLSNESILAQVNNRPEHIVQFYRDDKFLIDAVSGFVGSALAAGDAAVIIATTEHLAGVEQLLHTRGLEISKAPRHGRLIALDATETLSKFMVDNLPDNELFRATIGPALARAASAVIGEKRRVAAFGEMVNILWATGNYEGALRLEQLWNQLAEQHSFSLLCAYPIAGFNRVKHGEAFLKICGEHSVAFPSESFPVTSQEETRLRNVTHLQQQVMALQSEGALLRSEERFRLFVEAVRDYAIFMLDPQGNITTWNTGAERIKGYKPWEIIGKHFSVFYPEEDLKSRKPWRELEVAAEEGRFEDEGWRLRKDGSKFWANVIITALKNEDGQLFGFGKVTRDLTERRRVLEELQSAHQNLQEEVVERRRAEQQLQRSEVSAAETIAAFAAHSGRRTQANRPRPA